MHPVIKHILARKNKKVPVSDGRKIALVLFGGTMSGVRGGAAMIAFQEMGLAHAFDSIYGISAGFPNASYMLAECAALGCSIYYENLSNGLFFNPKRLWKMIDIKYMISIVKRVKVLDIDKLFKSKTKLFVGLYNLKKKTPDYIDAIKAGKKNYYKLLSAATSIPYFSPGHITLNRTKYKDYPYFDDHYIDLIFKAMDDGATDILVIYNYYNQIHLNAKFPKHVLEIVPDKNWKLSQLETDQAKLRAACQQMGDYIKSIFGHKKPIKLHITKNK